MALRSPAIFGTSAFTLTGCCAAEAGTPAPYASCIIFSNVSTRTVPSVDVQRRAREDDRFCSPGARRLRLALGDARDLQLGIARELHQVCVHAVRVDGAIRGCLREHAEDERLERQRDNGFSFRGGTGACFRCIWKKVAMSGASNGSVPRDHLVEEELRASRCPRSARSRLNENALGRHVLRRAEDLSRPR